MHKILLIDDEEHILAAMGEYFTMLGYQVATVVAALVRRFAGATAAGAPGRASV